MKRMILVWLAILFCGVAFLAFLAYKEIPASKESWKRAVAEEVHDDLCVECIDALGRCEYFCSDKVLGGCTLFF